MKQEQKPITAEQYIGFKSFEATEFLSFNEKVISSVRVTDALEACRLSKVEALQEAVDKLESTILPSTLGSGIMHSIDILTKQIDNLKK